ncbi:MAG TPA: hypothetical protein VF278_16185 [Pirellulales bacterium]
MTPTWNIRRWAWFAVTIGVLGTAPFACATPPAGSPRGETPRDEQTVKRGRSVIFRAGELTRVLRKTEQTARRKTKPPPRPHLLDTTLPILIQGAPHELALRRYVSTS